MSEYKVLADVTITNEDILLKAFNWLQRYKKIERDLLFASFCQRLKDNNGKMPPEAYILTQPGHNRKIPVPGFDEWMRSEGFRL